jgi:hypothetical protein
MAPPKIPTLTAKRPDPECVPDAAGVEPVPATGLVVAEPELPELPELPDPEKLFVPLFPEHSWRSATRPVVETFVLES